MPIFKYLKDLHVSGTWSKNSRTLINFRMSTFDREECPNVSKGWSEIWGKGQK